MCYSEWLSRDDALCWLKQGTVTGHKSGPEDRCGILNQTISAGMMCEGSRYLGVTYGYVSSDHILPYQTAFLQRASRVKYSELAIDILQSSKDVNS
ncbi:hypothetical protein E2C01_082986 [Portunus trituberculatus]|uniref:Uncharacterized protein n=1 Tax=Portunus trituberculatus TaxID=210409 RepID=A0A5B7IZY1_PORTR|nr:hypothetical protein [Portunus trituberculatus]